MQAVSPVKLSWQEGVVMAPWIRIQRVGQRIKKKEAAVARRGAPSPLTRIQGAAERFGC